MNLSVFDFLVITAVEHTQTSFSRRIRYFFCRAINSDGTDVF